MIHTTFYDYKIIVERRYSPLGAIHDAVPVRTMGTATLKNEPQRPHTAARSSSCGFHPATKSAVHAGQLLAITATTSKGFGRYGTWHKNNGLEGGGVTHSALTEPEIAARTRTLSAS
jgi:hypothetical protein